MKHATLWLLQPPCTRRCVGMFLIGLFLIACGPFARGGGEALSAETTSSEDFRARAGESVRVVGIVSRVGVGPAGVMHFINFQGVPRGGFVAVLQKMNITMFAEKFGADFPFNLTGKKVSVTGRITLYEGTPQIELTEPEQLAIED